MFQKKGAPSAKSLGFPATDPRSGSAATNSSGQVINPAGEEVDWPYSPSNLKLNAPQPISRNANEKYVRNSKALNQ